MVSAVSAASAQAAPAQQAGAGRVGTGGGAVAAAGFHRYRNPGVVQVAWAAGRRSGNGGTAGDGGQGRQRWLGRGRVPPAFTSVLPVTPAAGVGSAVPRVPVVPAGSGATVTPDETALAVQVAPVATAVGAGGTAATTGGAGGQGGNRVGRAVPAPAARPGMASRVVTAVGAAKAAPAMPGLPGRRRYQVRMGVSVAPAGLGGNPGSGSGGNTGTAGVGGTGGTGGDGGVGADSIAVAAPFAGGRVVRAVPAAAEETAEPRRWWPGRPRWLGRQGRDRVPLIRRRWQSGRIRRCRWYSRCRWCGGFGFLAAEALPAQRASGRYQGDGRRRRCRR